MEKLREDQKEFLQKVKDSTIKVILEIDGKKTSATCTKDQVLDLIGTWDINPLHMCVDAALNVHVEEFFKNKNK